jgi:putative flippase GtrA
MFVGLVGSVVDFGIYNVLNEWVELLPEASQTISFFAAVCSNFSWNRYWTYPDSRSKPILRQFAQFFIVNVPGFVVRSPIIAVTRNPFGAVVRHLFSLEPSTARALGNNAALALAIIIVMFWNFFVNRFWTYSDVGEWGSVRPVGGVQPSAPTGPAGTGESN